MTDIPYDAWADYIENTLRYSIGKEKPLVADLACGTGSMTVLLASRGFDMIGVDASADMLCEARAKSEALGLDILYLAQDLRQLDLFGTIDAAVSVCDGFNYLLSEAELFAAFSRCALFLNPGGIFMFDMNTRYKFSELLADHSFTDVQYGTSYHWKNRYDPASCINEYNIFFMSPEGSFSETHYQRAYSVEVIKSLLTDAGFKTTGVYDAYTFDPPNTESIRLSFITTK
jgi:SAM-dependent methyltransferase